MYKKIKVFLLLILSLFVFTSCNSTSDNKNSQPNEPIVPILNEYDLKLTIDESFTLQVLNYDGKVEWSVSDYKILTVDEYGVVVCLGVGKANVIAQADDKTLVCEVVCSIDYQAKPYIELDGEVNGENGVVLPIATSESSKLTATFNEVLASKTNDAKNDAEKSLEEVVAELIRNNPKITKIQMAEKTGKSKPTIERMLKSSTKIIRVGSNKGGYWEIKE